MADGTHIEWTDATWQIVTGCSVVSPGCTNCYAMRLAGTRLQHHPSRAGLTVDSKAGPVWNGQVRFNAEWLDQPLRWSKPRRIFVAAHGDLFHDGVTDAQLDQIFAVMALTPQHTYQVLTKRPERMRDYLSDKYRWAMMVEHFNRMGAELSRDHFALVLPLPNVWLGVSVEDQTRADERIPVLLDTPAAVRWISAEPLLGAIDLHHLPWPHGVQALVDAFAGVTVNSQGHCDWTGKIDWVIAGGESGVGARPMHPDWARQLRDQCAAAGVPFLFKQWGDWAPREIWAPGHAKQLAITADGRAVPDDVAPQDIGGQRFVLTGKKAAGRLLDGVLHDAFPTTSEQAG